MKYDFIFVVLVYRNTKDLEDFFSSFTIPNSKVVVVNSYYDDISKTEFESIAKNNGADFLNVPNKGYGAGNNVGCDYALKNYDFKYLIISNADIKIQMLNVDILSHDRITAPKIITLKGKSQNPYRVVGRKCFDKIQFSGYSNDRKWKIYLVSALTKIRRVIFSLFHKRGYIYGAHGAFFIIPKEILQVLHPIYNEKMFLFGEEEHLAKLAQLKNVRIYYDSRISVLHKEDGSTGTIGSSYPYTKKSFLEYYSYWYENKR